MRPNDPPPVVREGWQCGNLVGVVGNAFAQGAYWLFGFAAWCIPFAAVIGGLKMLAPIPKDVEEVPNVRVGVRIAGLVLMALSVTGLFQLAGHWGWMRQLLSTPHVGADAGGWIGRVFMTNGIEKGIAAFGATFLSLGLLVVSLCMALGLKTVRKLFEIRMPDVGGCLDEVGDAVKEGAELVKEQIKKIPRLLLEATC